MAKKLIVLNSIMFTSQKEALEYFKEMLKRYRNGQIIAEEDRDILLALLARHPEAVQKIGCVVKHLYKDYLNGMLTKKDKFRRYHHNMAQLRVIKAEQNLSLGGSERIQKSRNPVLIPGELIGN